MAHPDGTEASRIGARPRSESIPEVVRGAAKDDNLVRVMKGTAMTIVFELAFRGRPNASESWCLEGGNFRPDGRYRPYAEPVLQAVEMASNG